MRRESNERAGAREAACALRDAWAGQIRPGDRRQV